MNWIIKIESIIIGVFLFLMFISYQYSEIKKLKEINSRYQDRLEALQEESKQRAQRYEEANKSANDLMKNATRQTDLFLHTSIPTLDADMCRSAIKFAIQQAKGF